MYKNMKTTVIIPAAGVGKRMGAAQPKQYMNIEGEPMICKTVRTFAENPKVDQIVIVTSEDQMETCHHLLASNLPDVHLSKVLPIVKGGKERQMSVFNGLKYLKENGKPDYVLIHDAARPYVSNEIIDNTFEKIQETGGAVVCVKPKDTIRTSNETLKRDELYVVQTPQGFQFDLIYEAHLKAENEGFLGTDDAGLFERLGRKLSFVEGSFENIKITTPEDLPMEMRIGQGFDVHKLVENRKCIIGGVDIPYEMGLLGHSDADVLCHAITDAILGAANLGDIGKLFPDTDPAYKGADSIMLLGKVGDLVREKGYTIGNIDATVICERPKIGPHREAMAKNIADALKTQIDRVSIKATTTEKLGFTGRKEGIASQAVVLLRKY